MVIDVILFDLGGVLIYWEGTEALHKMSQGRLDQEEARRFWLESPQIRRFETGQCNAEEFAESVVTGLELSVSPGEFLQEFARWDRGPLPGALDLLSRLHGAFKLGCLSNNNELHWKSLKEHTEFMQFFDHLYLSHQIGCMKPDPEIFRYALDDLKASPERVLFFDDNRECVRAASDEGMSAFQVRGVGEVEGIVLEYGLLSL